MCFMISLFVFLKYTLLMLQGGAERQKNSALS